MQNYSTSFGYRQSIHDLIGTTNHAVLADKLGDAFTQLWEEKCSPRFQSTELLAQLEILAGDSEFTPVSIAANSVLLICCLSDDKSAINLNWNWEIHRDGFRQLPRLQRAALLNGFKRLNKLGGFEWGDPPVWDDPYPPEEGITFSLEEILKPLLVNIQSTSKEELEAIARSDSYSSFEKHLSSLRDLIWKYDAAPNDSHYWYPMEAVELKGHVSATRGFECAISIILMSDLVGASHSEQTDNNWGHSADFIVQMPESLRKPLLAGYRYLYETDEYGDWDPFSFVTKYFGDDSRLLPLVALKESDAAQITRVA